MQRSVNEEVWYYCVTLTGGNEVKKEMEYKKEQRGNHFTGHLFRFIGQFRFECVEKKKEKVGGNKAKKK